MSADKAETLRNVLDQVGKGAEGTCVADDTGLCVAASGTLNEQSAAVGAQLISIAALIDPKQKKPPVVCLQSDNDKVSIPLSDPTLEQVLSWMRSTLLKDCTRTDLLLDGDNVRPGVLVLVNDTDWELLDQEKTVLHPNDKVSFISTLHGG